MHVPHVRANGEVDRFRLEPLRRRGPSDSARILRTRVLGDRLRLRVRAAGIQGAYLRGEIRAILRVDIGLPLGAALSRPRASVGVRETLDFRAGERLLLDEHALPLIP